MSAERHLFALTWCVMACACAGPLDEPRSDVADEASGGRAEPARMQSVPLSSQAGQLSTSLPIPTSGLDLWLRADADVFGEGSAVSLWLDQSGRSHDASQPWAGYEPTLVPGALRTLPVVRFGGEATVLRIPGVQPVTFSMYIVGKHNSTGLGFIFGDTTPLMWIDNDGLQIGVPDGGGYIRTHTGDTLSYQILSLRYDGATLAFYRDGSLLSASPFASTAPWSFGGMGWFYLQADIAEVIIYDRPLSHAEDDTVNNYLWDRYFAPYCGDGKCDIWWEDGISCPSDCTGVCGDHACDATENVWTCSTDCAYCGDGVCSPEDGWCPQDCVQCGDGYCADQEYWVCPVDCGCPVCP